MIAYFTQLLRDAAPDEKLFPIAADRAMVASIAMIVRSHLVIGSAKQLPGPRSRSWRTWTLLPYRRSGLLTLGRGSYGFLTHELASF